MQNKKIIRYFLTITVFLIFLFFSNDFGMIDIQKTAIIMCVGIDKKENTFEVTAQIAVPEPSTKSDDAKTVLIESEGKTVADAFNQINVKTGWFPKLVFCNLIILGNEAAKQNVFDALDFFLRDEYMSDRCYVATSNATAKELLNTQTPIEQISSLAAQKLLSEQAIRSGNVVAINLRDFAIGYFGKSKSSYMPLIKVVPQQDSKSNTPDSKADKNKENEKKENIFSAKETALFYNGKMVETLTPEETFAFSMIKNKLRLASFTVPCEGIPYSMIVKNNNPSVTFKISNESIPELKIKLKAKMGIRDLSYSQTITELSNSGETSHKIFEAAKDTLSNNLVSIYKKCNDSKCDLFSITDLLFKYENKYFNTFKDSILNSTNLKLKIIFENLR